MTEIKILEQKNNYALVINKMLEEKMYSSLHKHQPKKERKSNSLKDKLPCCVCGEVIEKEKMKPAEYMSYKIKNGKKIKVINKKYRCKRCIANSNRRYDRA